MVVRRKAVVADVDGGVVDTELEARDIVWGSV